MAFPIPNLIKEDRVIQSEKNVQRKQECVSRGGTWTVTNAETGAGSCFVPDTTTDRTGATQQQPPTPTPEPTPLTTVPKVGGVLPDRTITDPQGNQRIQTPEETKRLQGEQEFNISKGGGFSVMEGIQQQQAQAAEQQRIAQLVSTIGNVGNLTEAQQAEINKSQALVAGTVGQIPSILSTAGTFAVGGAVAGGVPGAIIGGAIGIAAGIARGYMGNIKEQQRGELQAADVELSNARTNMRQLAMLASQDPQNADVYIQQYNAQLTRIYQARRQTKAEVSGDLNAFMEDGREQLADFDAFLQGGGIADVYGQKLQIALATGTPFDSSGEEFLP